MSDVSQYRDRVFSAAKRKAGEPIFNGSLEHTTIVMEAIFKHAKNQVSILTGRLNPEVYAQYSVVSAAQDFLMYNEHSKVRIIMEEDEQWMKQVHPLLLVLSSADEVTGGGRVSVRSVPKEYQSNYPYHFTVMDNDSYRYESDRRSAAAIAVFGDFDMAENFKNIFEIIWNNSVDVQAVNAVVASEFVAPPPGLLSLSSLSVAMLVAAIRLRPFQHKRKINDAAKAKIAELNGDDDALGPYRDFHLVHKLTYLSGEKPPSDWKKELHWPLLIATFLKYSCYFFVAVSLTSLFVASLYEFAFVTIPFKLKIITFILLWVGVSISLVVGMLGDYLVEKSQTEIDRVAGDLEKSIKKQEERSIKRPDRPPAPSRTP